jgi:hypothetical protein
MLANLSIHIMFLELPCAHSGMRKKFNIACYFPHRIDQKWKAELKAYPAYCHKIFLKINIYLYIALLYSILYTPRLACYFIKSVLIKKSVS